MSSWLLFDWMISREEEIQSTTSRLALPGAYSQVTKSSSTCQRRCKRPEHESEARIRLPGIGREQEFSRTAHSGLVAGSSSAGSTSAFRGLAQPLPLRTFVSERNNQSYVLARAACVPMALAVPRRPRDANQMENDRSGLEHLDIAIDGPDSGHSVYRQILTAIGAESCGAEQRQALPHKPCWAHTREPRRQGVRGPFCLLASTRSRSTHPYWDIAPETKLDLKSPRSGTGHLQS